MSNSSGSGGPPGGGYPPQPSFGTPPPWAAPPAGQGQPGAAPAQPGAPQQGYGYAPQPGPQGYAHQGQPQGYAPQGHMPPPPHAQGSPAHGYGQPPQAPPMPGQQGFAPPPGQYGYGAPGQQQPAGQYPGGGPQYPGQPYPGQYPGYPPPPQATSQDPLGSFGAPTNAWVPGALVSFFFPGIGLLLIGRPDYKSLGIKIFVGYIALVFGSFTLGIIMAFAGLGFVLKLVSLALTLGPFASLIHTHDMTVKAYPNLGSPILFKN